jgi:MoaA/NifB/PqqE/SkfB family radical SAM enzyme
MTDQAAPGGYEDEDGEPLGSLPTPEPVPDVATYMAEREKALAFAPERRANYERYMASRRRSAEVDYLPVRLDFENVSRCNFRCTMCQVSEWPKGKRGPDLSLEDFKRVIDSQTGLVEIKVQGLGEPTLQGDEFFEMIRYARSRALWVRTTTNASLLHLKDNWRKLIDSGVNEVQISIDGADKETFESIRQGAVFEQVVANCTRINAYCTELGIERTKMWTVVQKANRHQLSALVDLAHRMGFKSMAFSLNLVDFGIKEWRTRNEAVTVEHSFTAAEGRRLLEQGRRLGIKVAFWSVTSKYRTDAPEHLCPWPFERGYVASDLRIVPCCIIGNPDVAEFGDARDFTGVWTGETWRQFRQDHLDGRIPAVCLSCYEDESS